MKNNRLLVVMSLLSALLTSLHVTDDIVRGISPAARDNLGAVAILVVWLVGPLMLAESRWGYAIMLLGGIFSAGMPFLHVGGRSYMALAQSGGPGAFFFVWTLFACGAVGFLTMFLAIRAIWVQRRSRVGAMPR